MPASAWTATLFSRLDRIAGDTEINTPDVTYPASPPTRAVKSRKTSSDRLTMRLVSSVG